MAVISLYHGTDVASANDILTNGLDPAKAAIYNGAGEFWTSDDIAVAGWFAKTNPRGGQEAILIFEIQEGELQRMIAIRPKVVVVHDGHDYEFLPACMPLLNQVMVNSRVMR